MSFEFVIKIRFYSLLLIVSVTNNFSESQCESHIKPKLCHIQWSNYEVARGGLALLKDRVAPSKHLV